MSAPKSTLSMWAVARLEWYLPSPARTIWRPTGRMMDTGFTLLPIAKGAAFSCGRYRQQEEILSLSQKTAAFMASNLPTLALFITRSLKCRVYGRCQCGAGKKPAFWIKPGVKDGPVGHLLGTGSISSMATPTATRILHTFNLRLEGYFDSVR